MKTKSLSISLTLLLSLLANVLWAGNTITYTSIDGEVVEPYDPSDFGANIISNEYENGLGTITFDGEVTSIGSSAFEGCSSLTSITIPSSVTSIGDWAFEGCYFTEGNFVNNSSLTDPYNWGAMIVDQRTSDGLIIDDNTIIKCVETATSVIIPEGVTSIGKCAFSWCSSLTSITIPSTVTSIGYDAFEDCYFTEGNFVNNSSLTDPYNWGAKIVDQRTSDGLIIDNNRVIKCVETATSVTIPSNVTSIGGDAFSWCSSLTSITIPSSVTSIGYSAFWRCSSLTSITLPSSVTSIGDFAFLECISLTSMYVSDIIAECFSTSFDCLTSTCTLYVPAGYKSAYQQAEGWKEFENIVEYTDISSAGNTITYTTSDGNVVEPYDPSDFGANIISNVYENGLGTITFDGEVTSIGEDAFFGCSSLASVIIPSSVTSIGDWAFCDCSSLTSITIPSSVTSIGDRAFRGCSSLTSITIPSSVTSIGNSAFRGCSSLTSISIPSSVTSIGEDAFFGCSSLTSITIPSSVTSIGNGAFSNCSSLMSIIVDENNNIYDSRNDCNAIIETSTNTLIQGCNNSIIPLSVTSIGNSAFYGCSSLSSITIPSSVTSIGVYAFSGCSSLMSINIPSSVTSIGRSAFCDCSSLTSITIPSSVTSIGAYAFSGCSSLMSINIPSSVKRIEDGTFHNCSSLTSITIPSSVMSIWRYAFWGCSSLTSMYVSDNISKCIFYYDEDIIYGPFDDITSTCTLYVPTGCKSAYQQTYHWNEFENVQEYTDATNLTDVDNALYIADLEIGEGQEATLSVQLKNAKGFTGFQGDICLPAGMSFVMDEYGYAEAELTEIRTNSRATIFDAELQDDGTLRLLAYSNRNAIILGNEGEICTVKVRVADNAVAGTYPIVLKNVVLTPDDGTTVKLEHVKSNLSIYSYLLGDANGDREVNVGDLSATAAYILGHTPSRFILKAANANQDEDINVGDLSKIASIILGTSAARAPQRYDEWGTFGLNMMLEPMDDNQYLLHVGADNQGCVFSGFQFDLELPSGWHVAQDAYGYAEAMLSTDRTTERETDLFDSEFMTDGQLRLLCASSHNALFSDESGEVATILLEANSGAETQGIIALRDITYTATGESLKADDVMLSVSGAISSIETLSSTAPVNVYDMNGNVVMRGASAHESLEHLPQGVYVINGRKVVNK